MKIKTEALLNQWDVAERWRMSPRTLERWRWEGKGPRYLKLGNRIGYRIEDVEAFERDNTLAPEGGTRLGRQRRADGKARAA